MGWARWSWRSSLIYWFCDSVVQNSKIISWRVNNYFPYFSPRKQRQSVQFSCTPHFPVLHPGQVKIITLKHACECACSKFDKKDLPENWRTVKYQPVKLADATIRRLPYDFHIEGKNTNAFDREMIHIKISLCSLSFLIWFFKSTIQASYSWDDVNFVLIKNILV